MVRRCVVDGCSNTTVTSAVWEEVIALHMFPKNLTQRAAWRKFVRQRRTRFKDSPSSVICSKHFTDDCFLNKSEYLLLLADSAYKVRLLLRPGAIPSINVSASESKPSKRQTYTARHRESPNKAILPRGKQSEINKEIELDPLDDKCIDAETRDNLVTDVTKSWSCIESDRGPRAGCGNESSKETSEPGEQTQPGQSIDRQPMLMLYDVIVDDQAHESYIIEEENMKTEPVDVDWPTTGLEERSIPDHAAEEPSSAVSTPAAPSRPRDTCSRWKACKRCQQTLESDILQQRLLPRTIPSVSVCLRHTDSPCGPRTRAPSDMDCSRPYCGAHDAVDTYDDSAHEPSTRGNSQSGGAM